jgi:hypothetical protein
MSGSSPTSRHLLPHCLRRRSMVRPSERWRPTLLSRVRPEAQLLCGGAPAVGSPPSSCIAPPAVGAWLLTRPERGSGRCWRVALPRMAHEDPGKKQQRPLGLPCAWPGAANCNGAATIGIFPWCSGALGNCALSTEAARRKMAGGSG